MNYRHEVINEHVIRIIDKLNVSMYLILGDKKACLIDTGYGYKGLQQYVSKLTSLPLEILLSHGHIDHAFGIYEFDCNIYIHPEDIETYQIQSDLEFRDNFLKSSGASLNEEFQEEREVEFKALNDNDIFDLGNYHIQAVHVPGHTKGMMMFLLQEDRIMLFGDACGVATMMMDDSSANLSSYLKSLKKVKTLDNQYDTIYRNHGTFVSNKGLLDEVILVVQDILNGTDDKILLPDFMQTMFPTKLEKRLPCYGAKATDFSKHGARVDGKEGNVLYRIDKVK